MMKALLIVMFLAAPAAADRWSRMGDRIQGGGYLHYELSGWTKIDDEMTSPSDQLVLAGARMGAFVGAGATIGYHVALDLFAGSTLAERGFAYDVAFYPLGIAARFGKTSVIAIGTGIGGTGAVGTLEDGAIVPVQATVALGKGIRVIGRARVSYVLGAGSRQSAAPSIPFGDEFEAALGLRLGRYYARHGFPSGNGYFVAASYREQLGARFVGVTIGYSLDAAMPRRFVDEDRRGR